MYYFFFFFFNDTATTEIYTLSLHDALPISPDHAHQRVSPDADRAQGAQVPGDGNGEVLLRGRLAGARRLSAAQGGELAACAAGRAATGGSGRACAPPRPLRCG